MSDELPAISAEDLAVESVRVAGVHCDLELDEVTLRSAINLQALDEGLEANWQAAVGVAREQAEFIGQPIKRMGGESETEAGSQ